MDLEKLNQEFADFQNIQKMDPPKNLTQFIIQKVNEDLSPNSWKLFAKLSALHLGSALFTLSVCPQFGIKLAGSGMGLMHYFMHLGTYGCMVACGFFFVGTSFLLASILLSPAEVALIRKHRGLEASVLTLLSLGAFIMVGTEEVLIGIAISWFIGSILGAFSMTEIGWATKKLLKSS